MKKRIDLSERDEYSFLRHQERGSTSMRRYSCQRVGLSGNITSLPIHTRAVHRSEQPQGELESAFDTSQASRRAKERERERARDRNSGNRIPVDIWAGLQSCPRYPWVSCWDNINIAWLPMLMAYELAADVYQAIAEWGTGGWTMYWNRKASGHRWMEETREMPKNKGHWKWSKLVVNLKKVSILTRDTPGMRVLDFFTHLSQSFSEWALFLFVSE